MLQTPGQASCHLQETLGLDKVQGAVNHDRVRAGGQTHSVHDQLHPQRLCHLLVLKDLNQPKIHRSATDILQSQIIELFLSRRGERQPLQYCDPADREDLCGGLGDLPHYRSGGQHCHTCQALQECQAQVSGNY